jgi:WD40 repeat protein
LISTNDSRLRLFNLEDYTQKYKYKGHTAENLPIEASASERLDYIVSGSEDGNVYLWNCICDQTTSAALGGSGKHIATSTFQKDDRIKSYEYFSAFGEIEPRV